MSVKHNGKTIASNPKFHPDLLEFKWSDHLLNDPQWLRADTFSQQYKSVYGPAYDHLADETVAGITIQFYLADDKHKICPVSEESNVTAIYNATGIAWYYIIDTTNQWFKLPRGKHNKYAATLGVVGNAAIGFCSNQYTDAAGLQLASSGYNAQFSNIATSLNRSTNVRLHDDPAKSGVIAQQEEDTDQYKYLYFYVGQFTQTAIENTAGINTEIVNDFSAHRIIDFQEPTSANNYTWFRKYADGWVEQGGQGVVSSSVTTVSLPIEMANNKYTATGGIIYGGGSTGTVGFQFVKNTTSIAIAARWNGAFNNGLAVDWQVSGMAA